MLRIEHFCIFVPNSPLSNISKLYVLFIPYIWWMCVSFPFIRFVCFFFVFLHLFSMHIFIFAWLPLMTLCSGLKKNITIHLVSNKQIMYKMTVLLPKKKTFNTSTFYHWIHCINKKKKKKWTTANCGLCVKVPGGRSVNCGPVQDFHSHQLQQNIL